MTVNERQVPNRTKLEEARTDTQTHRHADVGPVIREDEVWIG